ncbi:Nicotinate dehydrogenase subunit B [Pigmentiphaga humi]|uniref:Nicotinate dehydrogenase subunit B n=1 Tax=Pigmentiphaga humi TaxID=2478468 RepID=A0A3P4AWL3_9BURK|nr:molybdopterin cofactor-binding domain-containing protein [Pigmentiphaga humi]VCU68423.1 Nicotinate dehydrogenase subunit B [Pigmentiphaga humi]
MTTASLVPRLSRRQILAAAGSLAVTFTFPAIVKRGMAAAGPATDAGSQLVDKNMVSAYVQLMADGTVRACNGHVDLGTGIRTAFMQIVADEMDVDMDQVSMVLGDTDATPNQGPTIASNSVQAAAVPMRQAAAQIRRYLLDEAARRYGVPTDSLSTRAGHVHTRDGTLLAAYGELVGDHPLSVPLDKDVPLKPVENYGLVGRSVPRVDIPAKVSGGLTYVHDMRLPGMLHARVVRPPYRGRDAGGMVAASLESIDESSVSRVPSLVKVVAIKDFVAVVARREEDAILASRLLKAQWKAPPALADMGSLANVLTAQPSKRRPLSQKGDPEHALASAKPALKATYVWPYQMHGSIGPSCGLADWKNEKLTVWSGSQNPHNLHSDIAKMLDLPEESIRIVRMEASGCYGRNCADDAAADAAVLARELGQPVRVQYMREEEHAWEPKGTAQVMDVHGGVTGPSTLAYRFDTRYPSNGAPLLTSLLMGREKAEATVFEMGDRTAIPQYRASDLDVAALDMAPIVRASWMRGVAALPNVFAHESFMDELAALEGADPIEFRLRFMEDPRPIALLKALAERAGWQPRPSPMSGRPSRGVVKGRGVAQHQYVHGAFPGVGASWCAWIADVEVDLDTGKVRVTRVAAGQDCGLMINPDGVRHQVQGNVIQTVSRTLLESVGFDEQGVNTLEWGTYPILKFTELPQVDVLLMPPNGNPPLGSGESASVPGPAAIANAIFDATGLRLREAPFTPARVKAALAAARQEVK